jgi:HEAT repeat protein
VAALRSPSPENRLAALDGLANLRDLGAAPAVIAVLEDPAEGAYVRETAARTLGQLRNERSVVALMGVLRLPYPQGRSFDRRSPEQEAAIGLKHAARQGLLSIGELARPALATALRDPDPHMRAEACQTLCYDRAAAGEAIELVAPLADDPDPDVRLTLARHVEQLFHERGREILQSALDDADERVRETARVTLVRLNEYGR